MASFVENEIKCKKNSKCCHVFSLVVTEWWPYPKVFYNFFMERNSFHGSLLGLPFMDYYLIIGFNPVFPLSKYSCLSLGS